LWIGEVSCPWPTLAIGFLNAAGSLGPSFLTCAFCGLLDPVCVWSELTRAPSTFSSTFSRLAPYAFAPFRIPLLFPSVVCTHRARVSTDQATCSFADDRDTAHHLGLCPLRQHALALCQKDSHCLDQVVALPPACASQAE
jgi:hypothetical protein